MEGVTLNRDLVIHQKSESSHIALLEENRLVEYHLDKVKDEFLVGDIYIGRVKKVIPSLNAAFVDVGHEKDAFLHYLDLGPNFNTYQDFVQKAHAGKLTMSTLERFRFQDEIPKNGKINELLKPNQKLAVQLVKEPISTKGPRLSTEITIPGRFLILIPFNNSVAVSKKIKSQKERARLKEVVNGIRTKNFGVIVRTLSDGKSVQQLEDDLRQLEAKWEVFFNNLKEKRLKLLGEVDRAETILRDLLNESFNSITVDDKKTYYQLKSYIQQIAPSHAKIIQHYDKEEPIFESLGIEKQIKSLFGKTVNIGAGAYLIIEHTEAMHVVDVNSGSKKNVIGDQESNVLKINLAAAAEIARQLRLRDIGGIIIVDFIDMKSGGNRKILFERMREFMKNDRAKHTILPITKFGLMQLTRQRVRPEISISTTEICPTCRGTGKVNATILIIDEIEGLIRYLNKERAYTHLQVHVHPFVYAYITKGLLSMRFRWMWKYKIYLNIIKSTAMAFTDFKIYDKNDEELTYN